MSKDIRSFFQVKKPKKQVVEEDDDVIPESPDVQIKNKKKESRKKKRVLSDDSDEDIFATKKKKPSPESRKASHKNKSPEKLSLKEVKVSNLFGSGPIIRTEPLVKKVKKNTETGIHSDEEFERSLLEVDALEEWSKQIGKAESPYHKDLSVKHVDDVELDKPVKINGDHKSSSQEKVLTTIDLSNVKKSSELHVSTNKKVKEEKRSGLDSNKTDEVSSSTPRNDKKRDFSAFVESSESSHQENSEETPKSKKKRINKSLNESVLTDEERHERKIHSAALYQKYLNRSGPKHLGAKTIPEGTTDCLQNCAFLLTGVLGSFEREEIEEAIQKFGGCIKHTISKKVTHLLAGEDAGPAKMAKAQELGIRILGEDDFLQMIMGSSKTKKKDIKEEKGLNKSKEENKNREKDKYKSHEKSKNENKSHEKSRTDHKSHENSKDHDSKYKSHCVELKSQIKSQDKSKSEPNLKNHEITRSIMNDVSAVSSEQKSKSTSKVDEKKNINHDDKIDVQFEDELSREPKESKKEMNIAKPLNSIMWVDRYKPHNVKQIIGQHGDASCVKKLTNWLSKWYVNRKAKLPKPSPWAKNDDGGYFKAALLSGPPGVGKTTTVTLVCKELGFDVVEFNASDTRNKTLIKEQIGELLTTTSLAAYAKGDTGKQAVTKKHVLVMDEVDGMAGNEDRGGLQELIALIKAASVPIICMCNDRNSQKMRSLVNYCFDLRFNRPRVEQIKSAMMSICCKEGVKIPPEALSQLIVAANQDVRQTLNLLSMWAVDTSLTDNERLKRDASSGKKDIKLGPWDAVRKVFSAEEHTRMSINDKSDLFFYDYSLAPLFVQENYLQVVPHCPKHEILERISKAAECISIGDLVDSRIRRSQAWNLLPMQAMYSSVLPGTVLSGHVAGQINFPGWLGKNSRKSKIQRLCQEIHAHTRLSTSGSKSSIYLDYCCHLRDAIVNPLIKEKSDGVDKALEVLESYHLLREDLDSLTELAQWPGQRDPMVLVDSKVKAAMTRTYNKKATALPYAPGAVKKGRAKDTEGEDEDETVDDEEQDSDPENDALIKKKKVEKPSTSKEKAGSCKSKASSSKEKASSSKTKKK